LETPTILFTDKLEQFTFYPGNRSIQPTHVANLVKNIREKNLLAYNPIIVDDSGQIIDGQHRFVAASRLGVGIYYVVASDLTLNDVIALNDTAKVWRFTDYMESYILAGKEDYKTLKHFAEKYRLSYSNALAMLASAGREGNTQFVTAPYRAFKQGNFEVIDLPAAKIFAKKVMEISTYCEGRSYADRDFIQSLFFAYENCGISHELLIERIQRSGTQIQRRQVKRDYLRQLEDIYNFGQSSAGRVRLYN